MFGTLRLVLALTVLVTHLDKNMWAGPAAYAVWSFFLLSGFLMSAILNEKYGFTSKGIRKFAAARFWRIFPDYWLCLTLGTLALLAFGAQTAINPEFTLPANAKSWFRNIALQGFWNPLGRPVPVSNALGIEVSNYMLMPLVARRWWTALIFTIIGVAATLWVGFQAQSFYVIDQPAEFGLYFTCSRSFDSGLTFAVRYASLVPCFTAFGAGSLAYFGRKWLRWGPGFACAALAIYFLLPLKYPDMPWSYGLYLLLPIIAWAVCSLWPIKPPKWDKALGDLSYPVYLFHALVGACVGRFLTVKENPFCFVSLVLTLVFSQLLVSFWEPWVASVRKAIERLFTRERPKPAATVAVEM